MPRTSSPAPQSLLTLAATSLAIAVALTTPAQADGVVATATMLDAGAGLEAAQPDVVTVYGSRVQARTRDVPGTVTVIEREAIELAQPSSLMDVIADVPGVQVSGGPRRTGETVSIRGLGGQRVLILVDGAPQSFISAHDGRVFMDPELLRSVEVVRGPTSALYGSGALGGVIALRSADAGDLLADDQSVGLRVRVGGADGNDETLLAVTGFGRTSLSGGTELDGLISLGSRQSGDISLGGNAGNLQSDDDIVTGLARGTIRFANGATISASYQAFTNEALEPNNGQGVIVADPILAALVDKRATSKTARVTFGYRPSSSGLIDFAVTPFLVSSEVDELDRATGRGILRDVETRGITVQNVSRFSWPDGAISLVLGGDWREDEQVGRDTAGVSGLREGVPNGSTTFSGVFAEAQIKLDTLGPVPGSIIIAPAVRWDRFENEAAGQTPNRDEAISPKVGVLWRPVEAFSLFANWGRGFRAPSINELYLTGTHFRLPHPVLGARTPIVNSFIANPTLRPEEMESVEYGFAIELDGVIQPDDSFSVRVARYEADVTDLIDLSVNFAFPATCFAPRTFLPCNAGTTESRNVASARIDGLEAELFYDAPRFAASLTYAGVDGRNTATNAYLGILSPPRLTLDLRAKLPEHGVVAGVRVLSASDFTLVNAPEERRDGFTVASLYARYQPQSGPLQGLTFDAGIENLGNARYERVFAGVPEPGQSLKLTITWQGGW